MNRKFLYKILRIFVGIVAVLIMSVSFSDYSVTFKPAAKTICAVIEKENPLLYTYSVFDKTDKKKDIVYYAALGIISPYAAVLVDGVNEYRLKNNMDSAMLSENIDELIRRENESVNGNATQEHADVYDEQNAIADNESNPAGVTADGENTTDANGVENETTEGQQPGQVQPVTALNTSETEIVNKLKETGDSSFLLKHFYIVDSTTSVKKSMFKVKKMLKNDYSIKKTDKPQILIYHTHGASEGFADSRAGVKEDGIVGVGDCLAEILTNTYGYNVIHDRTNYDMINGKLDRSYAYANALSGISKLLRDNTQIQVIIDLHRDAAPTGKHTTVNIDGNEAAKVMLFNGTSRSSSGERAYLHNDNLFDNLAFSLQLKIKGMELYPGLFKPIYLKGYRYNLHLAKRCLLIELGNQNNTINEEKNAIPPLAHVLDEVLSGR